MPPETASRSLARRLLIGLVSIGIDLRPVLRRARDALLRPVRNEMAALQAERENQRAELRTALAPIESQLREISSRLTAERIERRSRASILERLITESPGPLLPAVVRFIDDMPSPIVSVILPTRDREHVIGDAIVSVQSQNFTDWELIIVDDGSTDDTVAVVAPYLADSRIRYVEQSNSGASAARNHGLRLARGSLIAYLDSDNVWYQDFLTVAVREFAVDPAIDVVYGVLVTDEHALDGTRLLWRPFDRDELLAGNYIDINTIVHRRSLVQRYGEFDEELSRLNDWDLILRYTQHVPARALLVLAAHYRVRDAIRITDTVPYGPDMLIVKKKWYPLSNGTRQRRVLYVLWQYPQLSETYIEVEINCMLRWGVHVEVWRERAPAFAHPSSVPTHDGSLVDAVHRVQPDIIHVHWIGFVAKHTATLAQIGLPVTVRLHGFDTTPENIRAVLALPWIRALYGFPHHLRLIGRDDPKLHAVPAAFNTTLFQPCAEKDRRLVLRAGAALPSKDMPFFLELAKRLPEYRFVLAAITCTDAESYVDNLRDIHRQMNTPCELLFDIQQEELAVLMKQAGIYVHTARPPEAEHGTPIGMPISIAEAMATGAYVLVRDLPELRDYVADAGTAYRDVDHAAKIIAATGDWPEKAWKKAWLTSVDRAFSNHAGEVALRQIFEDWCSIMRESHRA
jgi:glycosyltransferase involved in cell wall biosynthesis